MLADPAQARSASIALRDSVGGDQPNRAAIAHEVEGATEEVGHEVGTAARLLVKR